LQEVLLIQDYHEGNITKKEKEDIKLRYTTFNEEFERTVQIQAAFSVPNDVSWHLISVTIMLCVWRAMDFYLWEVAQMGDRERAITVYKCSNAHLPLCRLRALMHAAIATKSA
jgi:hypothetical protein